MDFFLELLRYEAAQRSKNEVIKRRKPANLPLKNDLGTYDAGGRKWAEPDNDKPIEGV